MFKNVSTTLQSWFYNLRAWLFGLPRHRYIRNSRRYITGHPFTAFIIVLVILLILIVAGSFIGKPQQDEVAQKPTEKEVTVHSIGTAPTVQIQGQVEKAGVVNIIAQTAGIVQKINFQAGDSITRGQAVVNMSTTANGGNANALQASLAAKQYQLASESYDKQKEIIARQRDVANQTSENTEELRKISESSLNDTRGVLDQNRDLIDQLNTQITQAEAELAADPSDITAAQTLASAQQAKVQLSSGVAQLQGQVRNLEYQTNKDNPPTDLANLQKDITLKQLDLQERTLQLQKEIAGISSALAQVTASLMNPSTPFTGVVERVNVRVGQTVNPGMVIATISGNDQSIQVIAQVPQSLAQNVSRLEESTLHIDGSELKLFPKYVTQNATNGQLYSVIYCPPDEYASQLTDLSFISVDIPIGTPDTGSAIPYVPIDSVFQSQDQSYVFVVEENKAVYREVELGNVYGRYVEVTKGLKSGDMVITNRNVINGDTVRINK